MKNAATEVRNLLDDLNSVLDTTVESTSELEKKPGKIIQVASEKLSMLKYEGVKTREIEWESSLYPQ